ncbi:hypothetical protein ALC56_13139, partial [Trachymyrmex septentrionalis]
NWQISIICMDELMETAEKLNISINKSSLKDDTLLKMPPVPSIDLGKQDLSYTQKLRGSCPRPISGMLMGQRGKAKTIAKIKLYTTANMVIGQKFERNSSPII